ncbi:MAG: hypothetical protein KC910_12390 [Candidatus Eremiobacteraeota bacterium]|nr:hypothetical protein [Candidatus Eremiobacteraeota bacterium]
MSKQFRGLAIPVVLFFVMAAFFAASAMVVRVRQETQATLLESSRLQRESLARSAIASLLAVLNHEGTESGHQELSFQDEPSGMQARAWVERESDEVLFLLAEVKGGMGEPVSIQQVVHKKPAVEGVDYAQLSDGDVDTSDTILYRPTDQDSWQSLAAPGVGLTFMRADQRGGLWALFLPSLNGHPGPGIPPEFMQTVVAKNDSLVRDGSLNTSFMRRVAEALEYDYEVTLDGDLILASGGAAGNAGNAYTPAIPIPAPATNPERLPLQQLAIGLTAGAELYHYSSENHSWEEIPIELPDYDSRLAQVPGKPVSDGDSVYVPVLRRGADAIRRYTYETKKWEDIPPPPALQIQYKAPPTILPGAPGSTGSLSGSAGNSMTFGGVSGPQSETMAGNSGGLGGMEPDYQVVQSDQPSRYIVELETDADGNLYAHHGSGLLYTISRRDAVTGEWSSLPPPPGVYLDRDGKRVQARRLATTWGDLEVGNEGEVYVLWRASEDLRSGMVFTGGAGNAGYGTASTGLGVGLTFASYDLPSPDVVLVYKDGQWSPTAINTSTFHQTGPLATRPDGKLTLQDLRPMGEPDCYFTTDLSGLLSEPIRVPDPTSGGFSEYFGLTPGARPVPERFVYEPTAEW